MAGKINGKRVAILAVIAVLVCLVVAWQHGVLGWRKLQPANSNSLLVIQPYRHAGTWVFDDARAGLSKEPFVAGVPEMIDLLVKEIPEADNGFRLIFSATDFPGSQKKLTWLRGEKSGNYYEMPGPDGKMMEGWICPAMFRYFEAAPPALYIKAEAL